MVNTMPLHVLLVTPNALGSSSFYLSRPLSALARQNRITFSSATESQVDIAELRASDVVLFCRNIEPEFDWILQECLSLSIPTIYHLDDNLWEVPQGYYYTEYYRSPHRLEQLERYLRQVSQVHVFNTQMRARALEYNPNVVQLLSTIDLRGVPEHRSIRKDDLIRITYVTSKGAVDPLIKIFSDDLQRLLDHYPGLFEVTWWGEAPERFRHHPSTRVIDLIHEYDQFLCFLATEGFDIGLAPLLPTTFHLSKTNTKYRDYGACHIAGLYSDVEVYTSCVQHGKTGLIVPDRPGAWFEALNQLVSKPHLRQTIQRDAYQDVDARYRQEIAELQWVEILSKFAPRSGGHAGVSLAQTRQDLADRAELVFTRLSEVDRRNHLDGRQLAQLQGELDSQLPLARNLANELEAYRGRRSLRLVEGLRDRTDYADRIGPNFTRILDDSRLLGLAQKGYRLRPSLNLSRLACLSYRLEVPRPGLYCVQLAFLLSIYPHKGYVRLELASSDAGVVAHKEVPADTVQSERPVAFAFNPLRVAGIFELRLFAHDLDVPLRVYEWQRPTLMGLGKMRTRPFCALDFYSPA